MLNNSHDYKSNISVRYSHVAGQRKGNQTNLQCRCQDHLNRVMSTRPRLCGGKINVKSKTKAGRDRIKTRAGQYRVYVGRFIYIYLPNLLG